jgi:hypothetical protein
MYFDRSFEYEKNACLDLEDVDP